MTQEHTVNAVLKDRVEMEIKGPSRNGLKVAEKANKVTKKRKLFFYFGDEGDDL